MMVDASGETVVILFGCHLLAEHISVGQKKNLLLNFAAEHNVCVRVCERDRRNAREYESCFKIPILGFKLCMVMQLINVNC